MTPALLTLWMATSKQRLEINAATKKRAVNMFNLSFSFTVIKIFFFYIDVDLHSQLMITGSTGFNKLSKNITIEPTIPRYPKIKTPDLKSMQQQQNLTRRSIIIADFYINFGDFTFQICTTQNRLSADRSMFEMKALPQTQPCQHTLIIVMKMNRIVSSWHVSIFLYVNKDMLIFSQTKKGIHGLIEICELIRKKATEAVCLYFNNRWSGHASNKLSIQNNRIPHENRYQTKSNNNCFFWGSQTN